MRFCLLLPLPRCCFFARFEKKVLQKTVCYSLCSDRHFVNFFIYSFVQYENTLPFLPSPHSIPWRVLSTFPPPPFHPPPPQFAFCCKTDMPFSVGGPGQNNPGPHVPYNIPSEKGRHATKKMKLKSGAKFKNEFPRGCDCVEYHHACKSIKIVGFLFEFGK